MGSNLDPWGEAEDFWALPADASLSVSFIPFSAVTPNGLYKISFWYKSIGGGASSVGIHQNTCRLPVTGNEFDSRQLFKEGCQNSLFPLTLESFSSWRYFETVFAAGPGTQTAFLFFKFETPGSATQIRRVSINQVFDIAFTVKNQTYQEGETKAGPTLTFRQESPSKYRIFIKDGIWPKAVVLRQGFNKNWKLYKSSGNTRFLPRQLETFFLRPLPEEYHFLANGFANGWELWGMAGAGELVIEYQTERHHFLGKLVLAAGLLFGFGLAVLKRRR
jgi:hypothetical protein